MCTSSRYSDSLKAERSGDPIPVEAKSSAPLQTRTGFHTSSCTMEPGLFPTSKAAGVWR